MKNYKSNKNLFNVTTLILIILVSLLISLVYILIEPLYQNSLFVTKNNGVISVSDFVLFYESGAIAKSSDAQNVYNPEIQLKWANKLIYPDYINRVFYINYVPFMFALMIPLTLVSMTQAYFSWCIGSVALALYGLNKLLIKTQHLNKIQRLIFSLSLFISVPSIYCLKLGQSSYLILGLFSMFLYLEFNHKAKIAGILLALTTIKPQYIFLLLTDILVNKRMRILSSFVLTEIILFMIAIATIGIPETIEFPKILINSETTRNMNSLILAGNYPERMTNLRAILSTFLSLKFSFYISLIAIVIIIIFILKNRRISYLNDTLKYWYYSVLLVSSVFLGPHTFIHDSILLAIPAALTLKTLNFKEILNNPESSEIIWTFLIIFYPFASWLCLFMQLYSPFKISYLAIYHLLLLISCLTVYQKLVSLNNKAVNLTLDSNQS